MTPLNSLMYKTFSVLLGLTFLLIGCFKLILLINVALYNDLRTQYIKYVKFVPLLARFGVKLPPQWYCHGIALIETVCGLIIALVPMHKVKNAANVVLLMTTVLGIYQQWRMGETFYQYPALVIALVGRLVAYRQLTRKRANIETVIPEEENYFKDD